MAEMSPDNTCVPDHSARSLGRKPMSLQLKIGLLLTLTIVLLGLLAPWIAPHPWDTIAIKSRFLPPNSTYWLGTDEFGRDVLSRVLMGTGLSIAMGVSATLVSLAIGIPIGLAAGYFQGRTDEVLMRFADVLMAVPPIMLGLLVLAVTPPSLWKTALTVGFVYIPPIARVTRSVTLSLAHEDFIQELVRRLRLGNPIYKRIYTTNEDRYLAVLPKENPLDASHNFGYQDCLEDHF
ncbi:MAG: ABC transporter permease [Alcaligenaceae bacterium]|nr:ABC transporter permease [Alcaligenaceae bacterium]